ncbi:hypothetical protein BDW69DRAFT_69773 [Aspergillus filifer]
MLTCCSAGTVLPHAQPLGIDWFPSHLPSSIPHPVLYLSLSVVSAIALRSLVRRCSQTYRPLRSSVSHPVVLQNIDLPSCLSPSSSLSTSSLHRTIP